MHTRLVRMLLWLDKNLWAIPTIPFVAFEVSLAGIHLTGHGPVLLAMVSTSARQETYASLTNTASALLGFTIAAIAVLAAFPPRPSNNAAQRASEQRLSAARTKLMASLLATSFFMLTLLITSTVALAVDSKKVGNPLLVALVQGSALAVVFGLLVGGVGVLFVLLERSNIP
ncbi:hypothetical protein AB0C87_41500 [Actinomadura sp. NPDC048021]|uniref:hypothetical protein n=1 Tax=Actinomadura sp. NPDC048021 TaxID=3155385 RepID=UPI0034104B28